MKYINCNEQNKIYKYIYKKSVIEFLTHLFDLSLFDKV